jgi:hypothetical protein
MPSSALILALASSVYSLPKIIAVGSPGVMCIIENTTKVSASMTGIMANKRFIIYLIMRFPYAVFNNAICNN